ncbi:hypothetical protein EXE51_05325 [Halorubrum sp. CGM5_25_10-8B]|uniref:hypothetical protein n=1 Tax=Halorubrum sp. CGM5_25_10-8B TaxID=2518115 RepID=UPI0010F6B703|nr:hypothetical protein [Halorubrum sp. CGM5_25_10-8B]TKX38012.1 hypothetical protein EXE51_05325 [Halorubrum sp. CGM5_25_10-8B]
MSDNISSPAYLKEACERGDVAAISAALGCNRYHSNYIIKLYNTLLYDGYDDPTKSDFWREEIRRIHTQSVSEAVYQMGAGARVSAHKGIVDDGDDAFYNVVHFVRSEWEKRIDGNAVQKSLVNGDEGAGKTNWMNQEGFVIAPKVVQEKTGKEVLGISNYSVDTDTTELDKHIKVTRTSELDEVVEEFGSKSDWEIIVCLDEGDQLFGGSGKSVQRANELGNRIKLMRHNNAHILMTSQRQVAPEVRNRFDVRHKPSDTNPKLMVFADGTDREGNPEEIIFRSDAVPSTSVDYWGKGEWTHDVDDENDEEQEISECSVVLKQQDPRVSHGHMTAGNACGSPTTDKFCSFCRNHYDEDYLANY